MAFQEVKAKRKLLSEVTSWLVDDPHLDFYPPMVITWVVWKSKERIGDLDTDITRHDITDFTSERMAETAPESQPHSS